MLDKTCSDVNLYYGDTKPNNGLEPAELGKSTQSNENQRPPGAGVADLISRIAAAKTQADYAAAYAEFRAWYFPQFKARTWSAPESSTASHLAPWLKMLAENGTLQQNWLDGLADAVKHFKRVRGL